jgi:hypothetical protein
MVRLPLKEETAWERAQHEKFRARWGSDPFKDVAKLTAQNFSGNLPDNPGWTRDPRS